MIGRRRLGTSQQVPQRHDANGAKPLAMIGMMIEATIKATRRHGLRYINRA